MARTIVRTVQIGLLLACTLCIAPMLQAQGGPPLLTDDPGTPGNRNWEFNFAATVEKATDETLWEAPLLDINYGLGSRLQLKFEIPVLILEQRGVPSTAAVGNSLVGVKWRFRDEATGAANISIYPQLEFNNPGPSVDHGLVERGVQFLLPVQIQRTVGPVDLNMEAGYNFAQYQRDGWLLGMAFGRELTPRIELLGEVHGSDNFSGTDRAVVFDIGGRWKLSERYVLLTMAGRSFRGAASGEPQFFAYAGIQFNFAK